MFYSVGILIGLYRCQLGALNINKLVLISQNLPSDPHFSLEENANESLDDFGDCEAVGVGGIVLWRLFRRFCWFWQRGKNSFKHVHYICVATIINLVLHFIFSLCCFLGFFLCHVVKFAGDELTICYRWSLGLLACQKVIQPLHP